MDNDDDDDSEPLRFVQLLPLGHPNAASWERHFNAGLRYSADGEDPALALVTGRYDAAVNGSSAVEAAAGVADAGALVGSIAVPEAHYPFLVLATLQTPSGLAGHQRAMPRNFPTLQQEIAAWLRFLGNTTGAVRPHVALPRTPAEDRRRGESASSGGFSSSGVAAEVRRATAEHGGAVASVFEYGDDLWVEWSQVHGKAPGQLLLFGLRTEQEVMDFLTFASGSPWTFFVPFADLALHWDAVARHCIAAHGCPGLENVVFGMSIPNWHGNRSTEAPLPEALQHPMQVMGYYAQVALGHVMEQMGHNLVCPAPCGWRRLCFHATSLPGTASSTPSTHGAEAAPDVEVMSQGIAERRRGTELLKELHTSGGGGGNDSNGTEHPCSPRTRLPCCSPAPSCVPRPRAHGHCEQRRCLDGEQDLTTRRYTSAEGLRRCLTWVTVWGPTSAVCGTGLVQCSIRRCPSGSRFFLYLASSGDGRR